MNISSEDVGRMNREGPCDTDLTQKHVRQTTSQLIILGKELCALDVGLEFPFISDGLAISPNPFRVPREREIRRYHLYFSSRRRT